MRLLVIGLLIALIVTACGQREGELTATTTLASTPTIQALDATPVSIPDATKVSTPTRLLPTLTPGATESPLPLPTSTSSPTPQPTKPLPTPLPPVVDATLKIPDWASAETAQLILIPSLIDEFPITHRFLLLDAVSGNEFEFDTHRTGGYFWLHDGAGIGFLDYDQTTVTEINLETNIQTFRPFEYALDDFRSLSHYNNNLVQIQQGDGELLHFSVNDGISYDYRQIREYQESDSFRTVQIVDINTGIRHVLPTINESMCDMETTWSPTANHLAVRRGILDSEKMACEYPWEAGDSFVVFDIDNQEILFQADIAITDVSWSPDGTRIMFLQEISFREYELCILSIEVPQDIHCTTAYHLQTDADRANYDGFDWGIDMESIYLIYQDHTKNQGNFCIFDLIDTQRNCLTENIEALHGLYIKRYMLSENHRYAFLQPNESCMGCDTSGESFFAILDLDNGELVTMQKSQSLEFGTENNSLWQP